LSQDHLDYHGDLEEYFAAKRILFDRLLPESFKTDTTSIINVDDEYGRRLCLDTKIKKLFTFGFESNAQIRPGKMKLDPSGLDGVIATPSGDIEVISGLIGNFNLSNILAAVAVAEALNIDHDAISKGIKSLKNVPGRLERVHAGKGSVFVDYAHTPHAVKNVLSALASMRTGRIITIIGCGGDRDKSKRPLMGKEAALGSDVVILTSDNPRSEDASVIAAQTEAGITECGMAPLNSNGARHGYEVIIDRRRAIARALEIMGEDDILLVAGKGHETYQEISGVRYPFDDRKVVHEEALATGLIKARVQD
jgi:UDP-N-acetylmuramoyl-L-alanyl-D-glutamate--2,6-diaminopimelate ligase